jgi:beta-galactosidase/beta-glucuronidase
MKQIAVTLIILFLSLSSSFGKNRKPLPVEQTALPEWNFSLDSLNWEKVTIPHSYNALDGHTAHYYRGKGYYYKVINISKQQLTRPAYILFEGVAQQAWIYVNGHQATYHQGGYNAFYVELTPWIQAGDNVIAVTCDNHEDIDLPPVNSDFNKNGGLHYPASLLFLNNQCFDPETTGMHRLHVSTPSVTSSEAQAEVKTALSNFSKDKSTLTVLCRLLDADGKEVTRNISKVELKANEQKKEVSRQLTLRNPHLWNGLADPYRYTVEVTLKDKKGNILDCVKSKIGFRYYRADKDRGFFLNGRPYPLRGVAEHQDTDGKASALVRSDFDKDYKIIQELGCNFLRLAHYPHNDYEYDLCDSLGIIVQTEIPWVNVCGINANARYFHNLEIQLREMIANLYNHPSIVFWGLWNELDTWGNNDKLQGKMDAERIVSETARLYDIAKGLDPYRLVGVTDCSLYNNPGYNNLKGDFFSENRYNGWYYNVGHMETFSQQMNDIHRRMGVVNISEYGAGMNPFCHSTDTTAAYLRANDKYHFEEYGNLFHESHVRQMKHLPFLNFSSVWVLFDFPVAARQEGYMDSDDGINFKENPARLYTNDKGLVTRDRKVKKDAFYLYKSLWNHHETTVYITSRRLRKVSAEKPYTVKVYSNAPSLTLTVNGKIVEQADHCPDETGVIWNFSPIHLQTGKNTVQVSSPSGISDEITIEGMP